MKLSALCFALLFTITLAAAARAADPPALDFNDEASIGSLRFDFGGCAHTEKFSTDDAKGKSDSGSVQVALTFPAPDGESKGAYSINFPEPLDSSQYSAVEFDVKVVEGSALDSQGDNGYLTLALRSAANNDWNEAWSDSVRMADGWRHERAILGDPVKDARALTFQLWGGPDQNINGVVTLRFDNIKLVPKKK